MKRIAALLTVYNRCDTTLRCLRELEKQKLPQGFIVDIYLTDDGCTDGTPQRVASDILMYISLKEMVICTGIEEC